MKIAIAGGSGTVGSHIVETARQRGHDPVLLGRSHGIDVVTGAGQPPAGRAQDLAGPEPANLVDLARAFAARHAPSLEITADTDTMAGIAPDALLPPADARLEGPTFEQWLTSEDAAALAL